MENADLTGHAGVPGRGPFMILFLKLKGERVAEAKYHTVGCGPTIACGSMLTEMIVGRTIAECCELTSDNLIEALDGVPPDKLHSPALAIAALQDALSGAGSTDRRSGDIGEVLTTESAQWHGKNADDADRSEPAERVD
jgi:nitrogen fixation NifU-like protein